MAYLQRLTGIQGAPGRTDQMHDTCCSRAYRRSDAVLAAEGHEGAGRASRHPQAAHNERKLHLVLRISYCRRLSIVGSGYSHRQYARVVPSCQFARAMRRACERAQVANTMSVAELWEMHLTSSIWTANLLPQFRMYCTIWPPHAIDGLMQE